MKTEDFSTKVTTEKIEVGPKQMKEHMRPASSVPQDPPSHSESTGKTVIYSIEGEGKPDQRK